MSHLFVEDFESSTWRVAALRAEAHAAETGDPVVPGEASFDAACGALLHAVAGLWVLIGTEAVRVNGSPLLGGVRVLRDRDELRVGARRCFFSEEEPPRLVSFPGAEPPVDCARCTQPLAAGDAAVRCACGLWHHQTPDLPCWADFAHCAQCPRPTALDGGYRWSPDEL